MGTERLIRLRSLATPALGRTMAAAIPVILVNAVAFTGQLAFLRTHLPWPPAGQVMVALALESVAVYLAWHAHLAQLANDSALRLRLAAYGFALVIAAMNYSHYMAPGWRPMFAAVAVGLMSAASPFLWGIHSRRVSRDALMARGLVEPHALRLGATRWLWHPVRSARVMYAATWEGITDPATALTHLAAPATLPAEGPHLPPLPPVAEPVTLPEGQEPPQEAPAQRKAPARRARKGTSRPADADRVAQIRALLEDGRTLTIDGVMEELKAGRPVAKRILEAAMSTNGDSPHHG